MSTGVSNTKSSTDAYSNTVSMSMAMEAGFEFEGIGAKVTTTFSTSSTISKSFSNSRTISITKSKTANCNDADKLWPDAPRIYLYQWEMDFEEQKVGFFDTICHPDYPKCPLGLCADEKCTQCRSQHSQILSIKENHHVSKSDTNLSI